MKIVRLTAENIKRLTAVQITPEGNLVTISGKNGQGKSSVLDAIWWALGGKESFKDSPNPIRDGAQKALVKLELGDLIVERRFTRVEAGGSAYNTSLVVTNAEGARYPSPQSMLDALLGSLSFDPLAFVRMEPRQQRDALKKFVTGVDLDKVDAEHRADYDKRTEINRRARELRNQAGDIDVTEIPARVDEKAILTELEEAGRRNTDIERRKGQIAQRLANGEALLKTAREQDREAEELEEQIIELRKRAAVNRKEGQELLDSANKEKAELPLQTTTIELRQRYDQAVTHNDTVKDLERRRELARRAEALEAEAKALTRQMEERQALKDKAVAEASLPIKGLTFTADGVAFNGQSLRQASDADQLRVGMAVGAALNPKLQVALAREASRLDSDSMRLAAKLADEMDMQFWCERVTDGEAGVGFVIEDGHLKS